MQRSGYLHRVGWLLLAIVIAALVTLIGTRSSWANVGHVPESGAEAASLVASSQNSRPARDRVMDAWERAQASGTYQFTSDIEQTTTPVATALNAGRQGKVQTMYLEGDTNLPDQQLLLKLWSQGGNVIDESTAVQVRVDKNQAFVRQGTQPWQEVNDFTSFFAPNADFMSFLAAAKNIREVGTESRAGIEYTRFAFELDGPGYAAYMRDQMEKELRADGELPPEMSLELPQQYVEMTGSGELWITPDGWPLRQMIHMDLPAENESQISADITVHFSGFDKATVTAATPAAQIARQMTRLKTIDPTVPLVSLASLVAILGFLRLLYKSMGFRKIYAALNLTIVLTMLGTPWLRDASAHRFVASQEAKAQEQETLGQKSEMEQALADATVEATQTVQDRFATLATDDGNDTDDDGVTDVEEILLGSKPLSSPQSVEANQTLQQIPANDSTDTDGDGLTDYEEYLITTSPEASDSDGDGIGDYAEVTGFSNQQWFPNPLLVDSNGDGLSDTEEWGDLDSSARPDTDNNGVPDLFDPDNDGDGVPDRVDISPYVFEANPRVYSDDAPLDLVIDNLTPNELTYVELQLRPTNPDHLWYAFNVLDWPRGDTQASMQDADGLTFADIDSTLTPLPHANGDIKLIPVLEITLPQEGNNLPDQATWEAYNISVSDLPDPGDGKVAYVPLQIVTDSDSGEQVAFYAKMPYLPGAEWGDAHHIRLVWSIQALVDECEQYDESGECSYYPPENYNQVRIIQSYPDDWTLTGLTIRENIESKTATIYEDPTGGVDSDPDNDDNLWRLMLSLDEFFLGAKTVTDSQGLQRRSLTVDSIYERFDHATTTRPDEERWDLDNIFTVVKDSYEHVDIALYTQARTTNEQILSTAFANHTDSNPTLLFAREDAYRSLNLNEMQRGLAALFRREGNQLTLDMDPRAVALNTMATLKWSPYTYNSDEGAWNEMGMEQYWDVLAQRHQAEFVQDLGAVDAEGALFLAQLIYMGYFSGLVSVVEINNSIVNKAYFTDDSPLGAKIDSGGGAVSFAFVKWLAERIGKRSGGIYSDLVLYRDYGGLAIKSGATKNLLNPLESLRKGLSSGLSSVRNFTVMVTVVAALVTLAILAVTYIDEPGVRITVAVAVVLIGTAYLIVKPAIALYNLAEGFVEVGLATTKANGLLFATANAENINRGIISAAIVGLVISVGIALGIFIWAVSSGNISAGTPAYNQLVGQLVASIVVAVIIFALSLTLVGLIVIGFVTLIDLFLLALGEDFSITGALTRALADAFFDFQLMVKNPQVDTSSLQLDFIGDGAEKGLIAGNPLQLSLIVSTTITHKEGRGLVNESHFTERNLRSTTIAHQLDATPIELSVDRGIMRNEWHDLDLVEGYFRDARPNRYYSGSNVQMPFVVMTPTVGINASTPIYLNSGFALPGISCAYKFLFIDCDTHTLRGSNSSDIGSGLVLDVLPATLDAFYALDWGGERPFPLQRDHDGDGLIASAFGGADPNDSLTECNGGLCWDFDGDGYSDQREVALQVEGRRNSPSSKDADSDGICDPEELRLGTDPQKRDTDGDGLMDSEEIWHYSCIHGEWRGGWEFQAGAHSILMVSDPLVVDADGDGLSDRSERDLYESVGLDDGGVPYHPNIPNDNPLRLTIDFSDAVVGPEQSFVVTTTVRNDSSQWAYGTVTTSVPDLSTGETGEVVAETFPNLSSGQIFQQIIPLTVPNGANSPAVTFTASAAAGANSGSIEPVWSWVTNPLNSTATHAYGVALTEMPAAIANQTNGAAFSAATLERPAVSDPAYFLQGYGRFLASGFNRQIAGNGGYGGKQEINRSPAATQIEYSSNMVVDTPPDVACNSAGECLALTASAYWYNCKIATLNSIHAINQNDQSGGSEFYIVQNGRDWNDDFSDANGNVLWRDSGSMNDGDIKTINGVSFQWCEGDTLNLWEGDGNGYKDDDQYGSASYDPAFRHIPDTRVFTFNPNNNVNVAISVTFDDPAEGQIQPRWVEWDNSSNCTTIDIEQLTAIQTNDGGTGGAVAEYYIQLNGTNRGTQGSHNAEGTRIWTYSNGVSSGGTLPVNATVTACRGDTIDVWEDDPGSNDDFICSIPVLGNGPANPMGDPTKTTESGYGQTLGELGWMPDGGVCSNGNNTLDLRMRAEPNLRTVMTAALFDADGALVDNASAGLVVRPELAGSATNSWQTLSKPAVASNGVHFLAAWIREDGLLEFRRILTGPDGGEVSDPIQTYSAAFLPAAARDVDIVWVGSRYLVAVEAADNKIYAFYMNGIGGHLSSPQNVAGGNYVRRPNLAYNPQTGKAMLVYDEANTGRLIGRIISNDTTNPTIGPPIVLYNQGASAPVPEVAYYAENDIWIVGWTSLPSTISDSEIKYRALRSDGSPFATAVLPIQTISVPVASLNLSLACDQKTENSSCAIASYEGFSGSSDLLVRTFRAIKTPLNLNDFTPATSRALIIDTTPPATTLSLPDDNILAFSGTSILLTGQARDAESSVEKIEISFDGGSFVEVTDGPDENSQKDAWAHEWTPANGDGTYDIDVRLTDRAGNVGTDEFQVTVDSTVPAISSISADNALLPVTQDGNGTWAVTLSGAVNDASGVTAVVAATQQGDVASALSCSNNDTTCTWSLDYPLPPFDGSSGLSGPSGAYTAHLHAVANSGKTNELPITFRVDGAAPIAELLIPDPNASLPFISTGLTLTGTVTDPGDVASGVQSLQIDLIEAGSGITPTWQTADNVTLDTVGAIATTWSYDLPPDIEGSYEIVLRGTDVAQNVNDLPGAWFSGWQGFVDTRPPQATVTVTPVGRGSSLKYHVSAVITDAYLTEEGWDFICDSSDGERTTVTDTLSGGDSLNERLVGLDVSCKVKAKDISDPVTLRVFDAFGNQTTVTTPLPQSTATGQSSSAQTSSARTSLAQTSLETTAASGSVIASTVLTPTNNSVLTSYDPVTITGAAYADGNLDELSLSINGTEVYTESWASMTVTDTLWTTTWTPAADGVYEFVAVATDQSGGTQTVLQPVTVIVDTQPPAVAIDTVVLTETQQLAVELVELTGTVSENLGLKYVLVSIDGAPAERADFDATIWRYVWPVDFADDGTTYSVAVSASDGGNVTTVTEAVTVDIFAPAETNPMLSVTGGSTPVTVDAGDTARDPQATTLALTWTESSDGSGIDRYEVQWNQALTPTVGSMTTYQPGGTLSHQEAGSEATAWLAHLRIVDGVGNSILQTEGPIYIDAPTTPDYINPADGLTTTVYRGWMDSGCSQIGANYEVFRNALDGTTLTAVQEMYLTWDDTNLRMAWTGANWDVDGDLYIYMDTGSGGATTAYNPYGTAVTIDLPGAGGNQFGADYLIQIEDRNSAMLFSWDGAGWIEEQTLGRPNYLYADGITDLYLPLSLLGDPTQMKMVALASEEEDLHLWAAMPDKNPLNSELVANSAALPFLDMPFSLSHQYEWTNIGAAGVCPAAGQFENTDLTISLTSTPSGAQVGYLAQDLPGLLQSNGLPKVQLDSNNSGIADLNEDGDDATYLPLDTDPSPIGPGGTATYTLRITNDGTADATGVQVDLAAYGAMSLGSGTVTPVTLGTIPAGSFVEHTFTVEVDQSTTVDGGEVKAIVSDAVHGNFDWLWVLYEIDHEGPTDVNITGPQYINPDLNQIYGIINDASDVPTIILEEVGGSGSTTCSDPSPADGNWICVWDATGLTAASIQLHAKGVDEWGNEGAFGSPFTFILDDEPPTISLDAATISALSDGLLLEGELLMQGVVSDDNAAALAELCVQEASESEPTCTAVKVDPDTGHWAGSVPADLSADGVTYTFTFYGIDVAGNRSVTPLTYSNILVDTAGPDIDVTTFVQTPIENVNTDVLGGTIVDGSGVASMTLWISKLDGTESVFRDDIRNGQTWLYNRTFSDLGDYSISIEATDTHGNTVNAGPFVITVIPTTANLPPITGLGTGYVVNEGSTLALNANASDPNGDNLTIEWDLDNNGSFETSGETATFDATAIDAAATPQEYTVSVRVSDGANNPVEASTVVSVVNATPNLSNLSATAIAENGTTTLTGAISDPAPADSFTLTVDWKDGSAVETYNYAAGTASFSLTHQYLDDNPAGTPVDNIAISLTISDDDGGSSQASTIVQVSNSNPTLTNVTATTIDENGFTTLAGNITDAGTLDEFTLELEWGDGSEIEVFDYVAGTTSFNETHQYLDDNPSGTAVDAYTVDLALVDDDTGSDADSVTVTVTNLNPMLSNVTITDVNEDGVATLTGNLADVGSEDSFTLEVDWGDGSAVDTYAYDAGTTAFTETHRYLDDNPSGTASDPYTVNLTLTDDDTGSDSASTTVTVSNLNPALSNVAITDVNEDGLAILTGNMADVGTQDTFTLQVDWGDGSADSTYIYAAGTTAFNETHQYLDDNPSGTASDPYTVNLTLTDDDTGSATDSATVTVTNLDPTLSNVAITDVNEDGLATLTGNMADIGTQDSFTLDVDWGDGSAVDTYAYAAGTTAFTETHRYLDDNPSGTADDDYTVDLTLTDDDTGSDSASTTVTVSNLNPALSNVTITDVNEDGLATLTGNMADVGTQDTFTLQVDWGDGSADSTYIYAAGTTAFNETHQYLDDNPSGTASDPYTVNLTLTDDDTGSATDSATVTVTNVDPVLSADVSSQEIQYSDDIANTTITGTDVDGDPLQASNSWSENGGVFVSGLPVGMSLSANSCTTAGNLQTCTWMLSGIADVSAGTYIVRVTIKDDDLGQSSIDLTIEVTPEDSVVTFDGDNPVAVQVTEPESNASLPFEMIVYIEELEPDQALYQAAPGDITLAEVSMTLEPVGPGSPVTVSCTPVLIDDAIDDYGDILQATCAFFDVPVNTYSVNLQVDGGYYDGYNEDVLVIYDPSLGFTTGGGWFYWPGTEDSAYDGYPGDKTNFGYSMNYNQKNLRNVKGSLLLVRHMPDGTKYRIKSNALEGLSIGDAGLFGWASFSGKATYLYPGSPLYPEPEGNHGFLAYVEDHDEPGNGIDKFWLETRGRDGEVILDLSMARPGSAHAEKVQAGNIVVPHSGVDSGNTPPMADFDYIINGLDVAFGDLSSDPGGSIVSWYWGFGDGGGSVVQSPSHSYAAGGTYNVTLMVTDNEGASAAITQQVAVSGGNQSPTAGFSVTTTGLSASFTDLSTDPEGTIVAWSWDFGDGISDTVQNPSHTFPSSGTYDVLLTATDNDGASDNFGQQVTVSDGSGVTEMYIADLAGTSAPDVGGWNATVTIQVVDETGSPVPNAAVSGSWSKGFYANGNCTTNANGQCTVEQTDISGKTRWVSFTVDGISHAALTYNAALNVVSSVRVNQP